MALVLLVVVVVAVLGERSAGPAESGSSTTSPCPEGAEVIPPLRAGEAPTCAHEDEPPPGVDPTVAVPIGDLLEREGASAAAVEAAEAAGLPSADELAAGSDVVCEGDGKAGHRLQAIYAYQAGRPDRSASLLAPIRRWAAGADDVFNRSAALTGGARRLRWVTTGDGVGGCAIDVIRLEMPEAALAGGFSATVEHLRRLGYTASDRKYVVWADRFDLCGVAQLYYDDRPEQHLNRNNGNRASGLISRIDAGCWGHTASVEVHEIAHLFGAVSRNAPNTSGHGHCTDESDRMCYPDGTAKAMHHVCPPEQEVLLDCNGDDYFNTLPEPGSWLAGRWNAANSRWLIGGGDGVSHGTPGRFRVTAWANNPTPPGTPTQARAEVTVPPGTPWQIRWTPAPGCEILGPSDGNDARIVCDAWRTSRRAATATLTTPLGTGQASVPLVDPAATRSLTLTPVIGQPTGSPWVTGCVSEDEPVGVRVVDTETGHPVRGVRVALAGFGLQTPRPSWTGNDGTFLHPTLWSPTATTVSVTTEATSVYPSHSATVVTQPRDLCAAVSLGSATFRDVPAGTYYDPSVGWLSANGITSGVTPDRYAPGDVVTRGQMVTFLWRLAGRPDAGTTPHFDDVGASDHVSTPTRWARLVGVTTGVSGGSLFDPAAPVTRGQMATFLHRFAGEPPAVEEAHFVDVSPRAFYSTPTRWARDHGITTGVGADRFEPAGSLTRAQMAAFLHRFALAPESRGPHAQPVIPT